MKKQGRGKSSVTVRARVWLESNGKPAFGDGRARLLEAIRQAGSIKGAAEAMGMSYRNAWGHLNHIEERLGYKVIERRASGSRLTAEAKQLLKTYRAYRRKLDREMQRIWRAFAARRR